MRLYLAGVLEKTSILTEEETKNYLINLTEDDCLTLSKMMDLLGDFGEGEKCKPYDYFLVPAGSYGPDGTKNKKPFYTTVGLWIFNKGFIEKDLFDLFKYVRLS